MKGTWKKLALMMCIISALTTAGCGGGGGSAGYFSDEGGSSITTEMPSLTAVNNLSSTGQPIRPGDWIEVNGSCFGSTKGTSYVGFTNGAATSQATMYYFWSDIRIVCRVPDDAPMSERSTVKEITSVFVAINGAGNSNGYSTPSNPTPNPSPEATPPSPTPSPTATVLPTPTPTSTASPTPAPSPTPSPASGGGGGAVPVATKLGFKPQPGAVNTGAVFTVTVEIQDAGGNRMTVSGNDITLTLGNNPGGATLSGTLTQTAVNGAASFSDLSLDSTGIGYTLTASSKGLQGADSSAFDVENISITSIVSYCSGPSGNDRAKTVSTPNGDAGTTVQIDGSGFGNTQGTVIFKGPTQTEDTGTHSIVKSWLDNRIVCIVPAGAEAGTGAVYAVKPNGISLQSTFIVCPDGMTYVPAGSLRDGAICDLYMGECEVKKLEFDDTAFKTYLATYITTPHTQYSAGDDRPADCLSWYMAAVYCNWMSQQAGLDPGEWCYTITSNNNDTPDVTFNGITRKGYRLADNAGLTTQSEWEYACRAGTDISWTYYWGQSFDNAGGTQGADCCWYKGNSGDHSNNVGQKIPNLWGLYDMSANVWEWCNENAGGGNHLLRGGGFLDGAVGVTSSNGFGCDPTFRLYDVGFRLVRTK